MENPDCVVIDISPGTVCPMCSEHVREKDMAKTCKKNISGHNVCADCEASLKKHGFGGGCTFCGYRSEREQNIVMATAPNPRMTTHTIVIRNNSPYFSFNCTKDDFCLLFCFCTLMIMIIASLYIIGNVIFSVGQLIIHKINKEDHTHKMELSLTNCVFGYLGWLCVAYIVFQILLLIDALYEKCCFPCWRRSGSCLDIVKKCCSLLPLSHTFRTNHQTNRVFVSG